MKRLGIALGFGAALVLLAYRWLVTGESPLDALIDDDYLDEVIAG